MDKTFLLEVEKGAAPTGHLIEPSELEAEILCTLSAHDERFGGAVDSIVLERYLAIAVAEHADGPWVRVAVKGGFRNNVSLAVGHLADRGFVTVGAGGYALTETGVAALRVIAADRGTDVDILKKPAIERVEAAYRRLAAKV